MGALICMSLIRTQYICTNTCLSIGLAVCWCVYLCVCATRVRVRVVEGVVGAVAGMYVVWVGTMSTLTHTHTHIHPCKYTHADTYSNAHAYRRRKGSSALRAMDVIA